VVRLNSARTFSNPGIRNALVHPLLDRAKRVFDRLAALAEDVGALRYAACMRSNTALFSRRTPSGIDCPCIATG
jgi:hypothetical protein